MTGKNYLSYPASGHQTTTRYTCPVPQTLVQPTPLITRLRPQEGSESGKLSARVFEPTQTPTAALQAEVLTIAPILVHFSLYYQGRRQFLEGGGLQWGASERGIPFC